MGSCMACRYSNQAPAQDGNAGLLKQALAARQMRHTQRLTQTYLTLSLADIARHVGLVSPQEAEQHILRQAYCPYAMLHGMVRDMCLAAYALGHCHIRQHPIVMGCLSGNIITTRMWSLHTARDLLMRFHSPDSSASMHVDMNSPSAAEPMHLRVSGGGGCAACRMVDAGEVYAQIDEAASTVRFLQDPERYDSASVVQRLDSQMKRAMALGERIRAINNKVTVQPLIHTVPCTQSPGAGLYADLVRSQTLFSMS